MVIIMKIHSIRISNFRGFENLTSSFHDQLTVVVGNNGAGKSSLLDAVSVALGTFFHEFDGLSGKPISKDDARLKSYDMGSVVDVQPQFPVSIEAEGTLGGYDLTWKRELSGAVGRTTIIDAKEMTTLSAGYQKAIMSGNTETILPLISYYGTGRLWAQKKEKRNTQQITRFTRQTGYVDCLAAESNEKLMLKWFEKMTIQEAQSGSVSPEFSAVKKAVSQCFEGITGAAGTKVQFNLDTHTIDVVYSDDSGKRIRMAVNDLSDGYRSTLSMIADIAYRMAILNPQLLDDVLTQTPGVVLIDEVDLHLHPLWQQRILKDLLHIFPNVQFIVTTHAPAVISSVKKENLLVLTDNRTAFMPVCEVYGSDANSILQSVMEANERPVEIKAMFKRFYDAMDDDDYAAAKAILDEIESMIGADDTELVSCQISLDVAEM